MMKTTRPTDGRHKPPVMQLLALLFMLLLAGLCLVGPFPSIVFIAYLAASAASLVLYSLDKWAAGIGRRRIRERNLHLVGLMGGWPGAAVAQRLLRHKSHKPSFQSTFRLTVMLNCAGLFLAARWY